MSKPNKQLQNRLIGQLVVPIIFSVALLIAGWFFTNPAVKSLIIAERQQMAKEMVNNNLNLLQGYNEHVLHGDMTLAEAQSSIINIIIHQRYGKSQANYFWLQDYEGHIIYHPFFGSPQMADPEISASLMEVLSKISKLVKRQNEAFISYNWYNFQNKALQGEKETYAKGYKPWGWIVCTGFMQTDIEAELQQITKRVLIALFLFLGAMLLILLFVLFRNYRNLQKIAFTDLELKKSESRFRGFVEHIDNGLMISESEKMVFCNGSFRNIFCITDQEVTEFHLDKYLPGWEKERVKFILSTSMNQEKLEFTTWLRFENQLEKFVNLRYSSISESDVTYNYLIVQDLTEQTNTLNTIDILSENLTRSPESVVITDLNGSIEYVNPGFERVTGYTFDEVKGKNPRFLNSGKMSPMVYEDLWKTISGGEMWRGELLNRKKDGSLFWEDTMIFPIKSRQNEIIKYSSIKIDITNNKRIEQELLAGKDKAEENERFKIAFLNNVSHEVRTPLNAIYGFTQVLKADFEKDDSVLSYLKIIEKNSQILLRLFDDILDVSGIESKAITLYKEDVSVKELLLKIVSKYNTQLTITSTKPVEIFVEGDSNFDTMMLFTDRKRLSQIFDKLLSNSVKFTKEGHIKISYALSFDVITFFIEDTGVGIHDREKEMIFNSFSHGGNLFVSLHQGVGLGLNIAKLLIELMGGELSFESEVGKGTTVQFTLPSTDLKNYTLDGNAVESYQHAIHGKSFLIAEDNDENFTYFDALLSPMNNIIRAKTGTEAVKLLEWSNPKPDLILMDILMPEMDGITAAKLIRKIQPNIPIIAVTAIGFDLDETQTSHFDMVLNKPISAPKLLDAIGEMLRK